MLLLWYRFTTPDLMRTRLEGEIKALLEFEGKHALDPLILKVQSRLARDSLHLSPSLVRAAVRYLERTGQVILTRRPLNPHPRHEWVVARLYGDQRLMSS